MIWWYTALAWERIAAQTVTTIGIEIIWRLTLNFFTDKIVVTWIILMTSIVWTWYCLKTASYVAIMRVIMPLNISETCKILSKICLGMTRHAFLCAAASNNSVSLQIYGTFTSGLLPVVQQHQHTDDWLQLRVRNSAYVFRCWDHQVAELQYYWFWQLVRSKHQKVSHASVSS